MSEITADTAADALRDAWAQDDASSGGQLSEQVSRPQEQSVPSGDDQGATPQPQPEAPQDSFTSIDPNSLAPELQDIYKSLQADYTRKTQEASPWRRLGQELGVDPASARQAIEFVSALQDPSNLVALHQELSDYLQTQGLTKAEADVAAATEVQRQVDDGMEEDYGYTDPRVEALQQELNDLKSFRDSIQQERQLAEIDQALARQETIIRQDHPDWTDEDVKDVYRLSYAYGANLFEAAQAFDAMKNRFISSYVDRKAAATPAPAVAPPPAGGHSQKPEGFGDNLDAAHDYAKRYVQGLQAQGYFDS